MVVGALRSIQFFKIPGFSKTTELCLIIYMGFRISQLVLSNNNKISP